MGQLFSVNRRRRSKLIFSDRHRGLTQDQSALSISLCLAIA
ncbi:hypothetical protein [Microcoleus sp. FACHB-831]|nr:hypothetical protein [Microcoleus sp. FACHB-831]